MIQQSQNEQLVLISSEKKGHLTVYEVQKQGVIMLRKLKNKKFRVIFNIVPLTNQTTCQQTKTIIDIFNENLLAPAQQSEQNKQKNFFVQNKVQSSNQNDRSNSNSKNENDTNTQIIKRNNHRFSYLSVSTTFKQISDNRVIIVLNAYLQQKEPPYLVIFGYLVSSLILYHNWQNEFSQQSRLTGLFCELNKLLRNTNIDKLNQNIKFKTGYQKTPYFLCLLGKMDSSSDQVYQNYLNEFYRFQSEKQNSKINCALETIIDYFPERSSLGIQLAKGPNCLYDNAFTKNGQQQIVQLGKQFESTILGRQLFNFQFTGTTIQNLAFEMCEYFNSMKEINLIQIYNKVIINNKSRIQAEYLQFYLKLLQKEVFLGNRVDLDDVSQSTQGANKSIFPVSDCELMRLLKRLREWTLDEAALSATNCMNLQQYLATCQKLHHKINKYEQTLFQLNQESGINFTDECYQILDIDQQQINLNLSFLDSQNQSSENAQNQPSTKQTLIKVISTLTNKLEAFSNQCISLFAEQDSNAIKYNETFLRLIKQYFQKLEAALTEGFQSMAIEKRKNALQTNTLKHNLRLAQRKLKRVQKQYELQLLVQAELKNKIQQLILTNQQPSTKPESCIILNQSKQFYRLRKQIEELQQQVKDKNNHIQELTQILQKFEMSQKLLGNFLSDKKVDIFSETTVKLVNQANQTIRQFYSILEEVKNVEKHYQTVKKLLMKEREKILNQKKQTDKENNLIKLKSDKVHLENQMLQQIILEEKKALERYKQLKQTLNQNVDQLEANNAQLKCTLAEAEGELQLYRKALSLVVEQYLKGKTEILQKFYKFLQHEDIKQMIKPILGKK